MDALEFIASLVGSVAWPATILLVLLIFKKQLLALAPALREVEGAGVKLKFEQRLEQLRSEAEATEALPLDTATPTLANPLGLQETPDSRNIPLMLAVHAPRALLMESWTGVEHALRQAVGDTGSPSRSRPYKTVVQELVNQGRITPEIAKIVDDLRRLRNEAAHLPQFAIEPDKAIEYYRLARRAIEALGEVPAF